jgi:selenocysteine-specific elongation factor
MATHVLGTAGHVDHGKSSLVTAITGINPDRLKEEQAREMTIELGFAWFKLPSGEDVGIVDVPGHRDFIENMLAGVGGIDAVLFVIAADEGVMPQTREHLAILDLLQIRNGLIALTKCDLIKDTDWFSLIEEDIKKTIAGTVLSEAPIIRVSSKTGEGIPLLIDEISKLLENCPPRMDIGQPRLPVDRVFSMPGFGTIVTGTLSDGSFKLGDEVVILPAGIRSRIRGIQNHKTKLELVVPGQRTAINLTGASLEDITRGDVITLPGLYPPTRRIDVTFTLLKDIAASLKHRSEIKFFIGSTEVLGSIRLLGMDELKPGNSAFLQIELMEPIVAKKGDRFILRRPSPGETLGGGTIIEVNATERYKRFSAEILASLENKLSGSPSEKLLSMIQSESPISVAEILKRSTLDSGKTQELLKDMANAGLIHFITISGNDDQNIVIAATFMESTLSNVLQIMDNFHKSFPLKIGISREELRSKLKVHPKTFNFLADEWILKGKLNGDKTRLWLPDFVIKLSPDRQKRVDKLKRIFLQNPNTPPSFKDCILEVGEDLFQMMIESGDLIQLSEDVVYAADQYEKIKNEVIGYLQIHSTMTVADFRDRYQTSRKYALAFLEYLDRINITRRDGDFRRLAKRN